MQKIEMRVYCEKCGDILTVSHPQIILNDFTLLVSPCKKCTSQQSVQRTAGDSAKILETLRNGSWETEQVLPKLRRR